MKRFVWILVSALALALGSEGSAWAQRGAIAAENGQDIDLAVGESRTISARGIRNYSMGVVGIVDVKLTTDNSQFVLNGRRAGSTTFLLIKEDGSQVNVNVNVFTRSPQAVEKELNQLVGSIQGVSVRRLGSRFVLDGVVTSDADLKRVQQVATLYKEQVDSLVQVGGSPPPTGGPPITGPDKRFLVRIDFYFVQYDKNSSYGVGLAWPGSYGGDALRAEVTYNFLNGAARSATATLINQPLPRLDLAARRGWAKVLKQATVIANNDTEATFQNGAEQNFPVNTGLTIGITRISTGTELTVLPHYEPGKRELSMKLTADVSDLTAAITGTALPGRTTSRLSTNVSLKLGQSLVLSGIRTRALTHSVTGLPLLSEIPVLGILFGSHSQNELQTEGAIFVVPSIIESVPASSSELVDIALAKFKQYKGDIEEMNAYDKRPGAAGVPR